MQTQSSVEEEEDPIRVSKPLIREPTPSADALDLLQSAPPEVVPATSNIQESEHFEETPHISEVDEGMEEDVMQEDDELQLAADVTMKLQEDPVHKTKASAPLTVYPGYIKTLQDL